MAPPGAELHPQLKPPNLCLVILSFLVLYGLVCWWLSFWERALALLLSMCLILAFAVLISGPWERRYPSVPWLLIMWVFTCTTAFCVGVANNHYLVLPYAAAKAGRGYRNVPATGKALAYADAGTITFQSGTAIDDTRALGLRSFRHTYCVVPVLAPSHTAEDGSQAPVQFWAVGLDCCGARLSFDCDDAGGGDNASGHAGGIALSEAEEGFGTALLAPRSHRDEYLRAVEAASALYDLPTPRQPVFIHWVADPDRTLNGWIEKAMAVWGFSYLVVFVVMTSIWVMIHLYYDRKIKRAVGTIMKPDREDAAEPPFPAGQTTLQRLRRGATGFETGAAERASRDPFLVPSDV